MALTMYLKPGEAVVIDGHTSVRLRSGGGHVIIDSIDGVHRDIDRVAPDGEALHRRGPSRPPPHAFYPEAMTPVLGDPLPRSCSGDDRACATCNRFYGRQPTFEASPCPQT